MLGRNRALLDPAETAGFLVRAHSCPQSRPLVCALPSVHTCVPTHSWMHVSCGVQAQGLRVDWGHTPGTADPMPRTFGCCRWCSRALSQGRPLTHSSQKTGRGLSQARGTWASPLLQARAGTTSHLPGWNEQKGTAHSLPQAPPGPRAGLRPLPTQGAQAGADHILSLPWQPSPGGLS